MDAIVLAGGYGTRMWPITNDLPKMLFPLGDGTVLDRILVELGSDERIDGVYVSTNRHFADQFEAHLSTGQYEGVRLSVEETRSNDEKYGAVGGLHALRNREGLDDDFLVVAGDNVFGFELGSFLDAFERRDSPILAVHDVGTRDRARKYGVVELAGERIVDLQEKPENPSSTLVSVGCYGFPASVDSLLSSYLQRETARDDVGSFVRWVVGQERVEAFDFDDPWFDVGSAEVYREALSWVLDEGSHVAASATVLDSALESGTHVAASATVERSRLVGTIVLPGATIRDSELRNSIVAPGASVEDRNLSTALVGRRS